tara:strand:+ start:457 stop:714 length:258 start_codon:yes stop_codon:yes gene_type:complete
MTNEEIAARITEGSILKLTDNISGMKTVLMIDKFVSKMKANRVDGAVLCEFSYHPLYQHEDDDHDENIAVIVSRSTYWKWELVME